VKAAVIYENGGPEVLRYEEVADPECPDGCVLVDVEAISIEGGDVYARVSSPPAHTPHVIGYMSAGTVVERGNGIASPAVGDRVVAFNTDGSHASKRAVPAMMTWPIPEGLDAATAACVPVAVGTAQECLFETASLQRDQTALIHAGAGGLGIAAIQLASEAGANVLATASSDAKLTRLTEEFGLDHGINYATESVPDRVRELTGGHGADVILDSVGGQTLIDSIEALAYRGSLISVGVAGRSGSNLAAISLCGKNNTLHGFYLGSAMLAEHARVHPMIAGLLQRVADGDIRIAVDSTYPLSEAAAAHTYLESRQAFGRVILTP